MNHRISQRGESTDRNVLVPQSYLQVALWLASQGVPADDEGAYGYEYDTSGPEGPTSN